MVPHTECLKLKKRLTSSVYLQADDFSNHIIIWCIADDSRHLESRRILEISPPTIYKKILLGHTFSIQYECIFFIRFINLLFKI